MNKCREQSGGAYPKLAARVLHAERLLQEHVLLVVAVGGGLCVSRRVGEPLVGVRVELCAERRGVRLGRVAREARRALAQAPTRHGERAAPAAAVHRGAQRRRRRSGRRLEAGGGHRGRGERGGRLEHAGLHLHEHQSRERSLARVAPAAASRDIQ